LVAKWARQRAWGFINLVELGADGTTLRLVHMLDEP
jgi:hypothetical protein